MNQPLTENELNQLTTYNGEINRGIMHMDYWKRRMEKLQERFNIDKFGYDAQPGCVVAIAKR